MGDKINLEERIKNLESEQYLTKNNFISVQKGMLFFLLIISGNYIGELLSCRTQKLFSHNMYAKHGIALISLYFFVVISDNQLQKYNPIITFLGTLIIYLYFLCVAKVESKYFLVTLLVMTLIAFSQIYKEYVIKKSDDALNKFEISIKNNINNIQSWLIGISLIITLLGLLVYMGMKKIEYQKTFTYLLFFLGKVQCDDNLLGNLTNAKIHKESIVNHMYNFKNMIFFIKTALFN
jgi:hypothetical protein